MIKLECNCGVEDLCPQGRFGASPKCSIFVNSSHDAAIKQTIKEQERFWCQAVVEILPIELMSKLLIRFNELRDKQ